MNKKSIPYLVVVHPASGKTAVYNRDYQLMFENASKVLVDFAQRQHPRLRQNGFMLSYPDQQPSWMSDGIKQECMSCFCYDDGTKIAELRKIPLG